MQREKKVVEILHLQNRASFAMKYVGNQFLTWEIVLILGRCMKHDSEAVFDCSRELLREVIRKRPDLVLGFYRDIAIAIFDGISVWRDIQVSFPGGDCWYTNTHCSVIDALEKIIQISPDDARHCIDILLGCVEKGLLDQDYSIRTQIFQLLVKVVESFPEEALNYKEEISQFVYSYRGKSVGTGYDHFKIFKDGSERINQVIRP